MKKIGLFWIISLFIFQIKAQETAIGQWRDHLSYYSGQTLTLAGDKVFCATEVGFFSYNKSDHSIQKLSKINGFSDIGIAALNYYPEKDVLLIVYENSNIDIVQNQNIYNLSDLKRKQSIGSKNINQIYFYNHNAYLACDFGIMVINLDRKEIAATYYIGANSSKIKVNSIVVTDSCILAATQTGILYSNFANNLADYRQWQKLTTDTFKLLDYTFIGKSSSKYYFSAHYDVSDSTSKTADSIFYSTDLINWTNLDTTLYQINSIRLTNDKLVAIRNSNILIYNDTQKEKTVSYEWTVKNDAIVENNTTWIADETYGLVKFDNTNNQTEFITPNGPRYSDAINMQIRKNKLWVAAGGRLKKWNNLGGYYFENNQWTNVNKETYPELNNVANLNCVFISPFDSRKVYAGSWGYGVVEFYDNELVKIHNETNSILRTVENWGTAYLLISNIEADNKGNTWICASEMPNPVYKITPDGTFENIQFSDDPFKITVIAQDLLLRSNGDKWIVIKDDGFFVFNEEQNEEKKFSLLDENGSIISDHIYCIKEDRNNDIWIGTNAGVAVYYNPENVFTGENFYAQRIKILLDDEDVITKYLLESESVTTIAIDGANRKWIGTSKSGVFLMSKEGNEQILSFNTENSPLISNAINSIAINDQTGEVFIATDKGIMSYRSQATGGAHYFTENVYTFPNPVKPNYRGPITITGLVTDVDVKITDISGNLVYHTTAYGGQAIWHGNNMNGQRVHTGVYLVYCSDEEGIETFVTKILFIN